MIELERETKEYVPVSMAEDGVPLSSFVVAVTRDYLRPTSFAPVENIGGRTMVLIDATTLGGVGKYIVWTKVTDTPEVPVVEAGEFRIV